MKKMNFVRCSDCKNCVKEESKKYTAHCSAKDTTIVFPDVKRICEDYEEKSR